MTGDADGIKSETKMAAETTSPDAKTGSDIHAINTVPDNNQNKKVKLNPKKLFVIILESVV